MTLATATFAGMWERFMHVSRRSNPDFEIRQAKKGRKFLGDANFERDFWIVDLVPFRTHVAFKAF